MSRLNFLENLCQNETLEALEALADIRELLRRGGTTEDIIAGIRSALAPVDELVNEYVAECDSAEDDEDEDSAEWIERDPNDPDRFDPPNNDEDEEESLT